LTLLETDCGDELAPVIDFGVFRPLPLEAGVFGCGGELDKVFDASLCFFAPEPEPVAAGFWVDLG